MPNEKVNNFNNLVLIVFGLFWIVIGIHTWSEPIFYFRGANVDFTGINRPVGVGLIIMGAIFISSYFWKSNSKQIHTYKPGEYVAIVNKKNKSFGLVKSLELVLNDKQSFTFYCTTDKVAAMLLNDFVVGQEATLKINTENGQDCDLVGKNAYAHGILIGQLSKLC